VKPLAQADAALRAGRLDDALRAYLRVLADPRAPADERAQVLCSVATTYRLMRCWGEAERAARRAVVEAAGRSAIEAHAQFTLGTVLLTTFQEGADVDDVIIRDATEALERAASLYRDLGSINFYSCLLSLAEGTDPTQVGPHAEGVYGRILDELADDHWARPPEVAKLADHLRARACIGLARIALDAGDGGRGGELLWSAAGLLVASGRGDPAARELLADIARTFLERLRDPARAEHVLATARSL
jgi:hypothetical protein